MYIIMNHNSGSQQGRQRSRCGPQNNITQKLASIFPDDNGIVWLGLKYHFSLHSFNKMAITLSQNFSVQIFGMLIKFCFRWYVNYYNYSKEKVKPQKCCFSFDVNFFKKHILIAFIFCSNIVLMITFHDSKFEVGMTSRSQVVATYVILIDVYIVA